MDIWKVTETAGQLSVFKNSLLVFNIKPLGDIFSPQTARDAADLVDAANTPTMLPLDPAARAVLISLNGWLGDRRLAIRPDTIDAARRIISNLLLDSVSARCGKCGEVIVDDPLTGTRCGCTPPWPQPAEQSEPIPLGIYWGAEGGNFYSVEGNHGQGMAFFTKWFDRRAEFPDGTPPWSVTHHNVDDKLVTSARVDDGTFPVRTPQGLVFTFKNGQPSVHPTFERAEYVREGKLHASPSTCGNCRFRSKGERCTRFPPQAFGDGWYQPYVMADETCGEWKARS